MVDTPDAIVQTISLHNTRWPGTRQLGCKDEEATRSLRATIGSEFRIGQRTDGHRNEEGRSKGLS